MARIYYNPFFKISVKLILIYMMFFFAISNVCAKIFTVNEVVNEFNNLEEIEAFNSLGFNISASIDTNNKTIDFYDDSEKIGTLKYTDEYIEYDNRSVTLSKDFVDKNIGSMFSIACITQSIINLSGYENKTLQEDITLDDTYDTYGIQLITEAYEFNETDDDGGTVSTKGNFIKYLKMSLDSDKIDNLIEKYGVDINTQDSDMEKVKDLVPTLSAKNVTENSVTLYPHIDYVSNDPNFIANCYIYRSTSKNGNYERISDFASNCMEEGLGVIDDGLNNNTTYYYKAILMNGNNYSDVLEIKTKEVSDAHSPSTTTNKGETIENPKTGVSLPTITILIVIVSSLIALIYLRKKSILKNL